MDEKNEELNSEPAHSEAPKKRLISLKFAVIAALGSVGLFFLAKQVMFMQMLGEEESRASAPILIDENRPKPQGRATLELPGGRRANQ